jgi:hypothetical protein
LVIKKANDYCQKREIQLKFKNNAILLITLSLVLPFAAFARKKTAENGQNTTPFIKYEEFSFGQCRRTDTEIVKPLKRAKNQTSVVVKDTIRLCTSHVYRFRAKAGQTFRVKLTTGKRTGLTVLTPSGERPVDGDALRWSGELSESGEYEIRIGTDAAARYTLEVSIE